MCRIIRVWKALEGKICGILRVRKALGGSMCRILRVWKLKDSINTSHLLGFGRPRASGRLNMSYLTCLEPQNVDKIITFALFWEATGGSVYGGPVVNSRFGMLLGT